MERPDVLIIGGGLSGLSAAARLGQAGVQVVVLEANARLGGALAGCPIGRYRMEIGPSWIDDQPDLDQGFRELGLELSDSVKLLEIDPILRYEFGDGRRLVLPRDLEGAVAAVDELFPGQGEGYRKVMEAFPAASEQTGPEANSLDDLVREHISEDELRSVLYAFGELHALEPQAIPAGEFPLGRAHQHGVFVPRGGFRQIAEALAASARAAGVQFVMGARVHELLVQEGAVTGVLLAGGLRLKARAVVATAPAATVYGQWLPGDVKSPEAPRILGMRLIPPPFLLQRSLTSRSESLPFMTILGRGERSLDQDAAVLQVVHHTAVDDTVTPEGRGLVRISASLDYPGAGGSWGLRRKALGKSVAHRLDTVLGGFMEVDEEVHRFHDPELLSALLRLNSRALYPAVTRWQTGEGRVPQRSAAPTGLYLAGSWTASGPGIGATVRGGVHAAELAIEDLGLEQG